jgi:hypothetical protein
MDKVYKEDIPKLKRALQDLRKKFSRIESRTDWIGLRINPLLRHVKALERLLKAPDFSSEHKRLRNGVSLFRSDLVYLSTNVKTLKSLLPAETNRNRIRKQKLPDANTQPSPKARQ